MPRAIVERVTRQCETCGKQFARLASQLTQPGTGRYCSRGCVPTPQQIQCTCTGCGKAFSVTPSQRAKGRGVYCSVQCRPDKPCGHIALTCKHCGIGFTKKPSHVRAGAGSYCSRTCQTAAKTKPRRLKQLALPNAPMVRCCDRCGSTYTPRIANSRYCSTNCFVVPKIAVSCATCSGSFLTYPKRPKRFCSDACHLKSYPASQQAERDSAKVRTWAAKVKRRDNHTCQHCGATDKPLHAHHLKEWSTHPELRTVLSNGLTLCEDCHLAVHHPHLAA